MAHFLRGFRSAAHEEAEDWAREADDDFCFNVRLHAVGATAADLEQYPAHVAASDLKVYSIWFSSLLRHRRDMAADVDLLQLAVPLPVEQHILHALVGALYSRSILLSAETVEACYRAADYLQMPCILAACVEYIHAKLLPVMPLEQFQKAAVSELQMLNLVLEVRKNKPSLDFTVRLERTTLASSEDWRDACRIALLFSLTLMSGVTTVFASGHLFLS
ncbi:hypothetical protein WJX72_011933 [[Myrmecia] bisecta]|uniref:BTB domain-containing protein n=1 Tax=[Myrmecia] bisecta TaxID=41462 RepID=A0AAW1PY07_9CHLO